MKEKIKINFLDWDSEFFGIKIGSVQLEPEFDPCVFQEIKSIGKAKDYKCIYVFSSNITGNESLTDNLPSKFLVDRKIVFEKKTEESVSKVNSSISNVMGNLNIEMLYKIALQAGGNSRFKKDLNFGIGKYEELYKLWIFRSLKKEIADEVYFYKTDEEKEIAGFITVKFEEKSARIGLLSVDEKFRGKGIAKELINKVFLAAFERKLETVYVATQSENTGACEFYSQMGMTPFSLNYIYHLWI